MHFVRFAAAAALIAATLPGVASAQAFEYPSFQLPRVVEGREYNFAFADGENSQSLIFQWREGYGPGSQLSFDAGFADVENGDPAVLVGGQYAQQLVTADASIPLDFALTVGANLGIFTGEPNGVLVRVPLGVAIGRTFVIDAPTGFAITPFVHPRASLDYLSADRFEDNTDLGITLDLGASFQITPGFAGRLAFTLGGNDFPRGDAFGLSLALTPGAIRRP
jgi:hypothetical protein